MGISLLACHVHQYPAHRNASWEPTQKGAVNEKRSVRDPVRKKKWEKKVLDVCTLI